MALITHDTETGAGFRLMQGGNPLTPDTLLLERNTMTDVVELIERDHRAVEQLFAQFEASNDESIAETICAELTKHTHAEERRLSRSRPRVA